ncbi:hypothetical protein EKO27_g4041 [Xylaria grammica]|uniref:Clr5 domain-containing protein n=1 Tax=Xylaria grammica TaxID=363999 RepID=A0A439D9G7_9PEZI|nr:hypothetical protein EKO27_g4041 [Xylaria grammica]
MLSRPRLYDLDSTMRKWGFEKNINKATWKFLISILGKRSREGKKSEVIHCGRRVKQSTINKETNRHQENPTFRRHAQPQSPPPLSAGSQVAVCTPPPHSMEFDWTGGLPWQEFINCELYENLQQIVTHERLTQHVEDSKSATLQLDKHHTLLNIDVSYSSSRTPSGSSPPVSKIGARIGATMPEAYPGENLRRANCLLRGSRDEEFVFECLTLLIYTFSNNIIDPFSLEFDSQWEAALAIIKHSGILNRVVDFKRFNSLTIEGFAENLFRAAMHRMGHYNTHHQETEAIAIWLLKSGQNPNYILLPASEDYPHPRTPLQCAIMEDRLDLVKHLLKAEADANIVPSYSGVSSLPLSPLEMATKYRFRDKLLPLLLKHGASANIDRALHMAIRQSDLEAASLLLENNANPYTAYKTREGPVYEDTALNVAAATGWRELKFLMEFIESPSQNRTLSSLLTADTFVAAVMRHGIVKYLSQYQLSGTSLTNGHGITPLHVAVRKSDSGYCRSHISSYDLRTLATPIPPLWLACLLGNNEIARLFIESGADVDGAAKNSEKYRSILDLNLSSVSVLDSAPLACIMHGAHHNDHLSCAVMVIKAGATLTGSELSIAVNKTRFDLLSAALAAGADPNAIDSIGKRPLQIALALKESHETNSKYAMVEKLLEKGAIVSQEEVVAAIDRTQWSLLQLLLSYGGNLLDPNREGITPLEACIWNYDPEFLHRLLDGHPEMYDPGSVCAALSAQKYCIAKRLVANRPTWGPLDIVEMTALTMAATEGDLEVFQGLLKYPSLPKVSYLPYMRSHLKERFWCQSRGIQGSPLALLVMLLPTISDAPNAFSAFCEFLERDLQPDHYTWSAIARLPVNAIKGNIHYAEALLSNGYQPEAQKDELLTAYDDPLCTLIRYGDLDTFEILLKAGANFVRQHPYSIHLATAIECKQWSMMDNLLTAGAPVNGHPPMGLTALQVAAGSGSLEVVKRLLDAGADVNQCNQRLFGGLTAIQLAVNSGSLAMVNCLLEAGADINQQNQGSSTGFTTLQLAVNSGSLAMVNCLLQAGADINQQNQGPSKGFTALQLAVDSGSLAMVHFLLKAGADVNQQNPGSSKGFTALLLAVNSNRLDIVNCLLEAGADVNQQNPDLPNGLAALQTAVNSGSLAMVDCLLEAGANVNQWNPDLPYRLTTLQTAVIFCRLDIVNSLLKAGADVNQWDPDLPNGRTALQMAIDCGKLQVVNRLLEAGADVNQWNKDIQFGRSPLQSAVEQVNLEIIDALLKAGAEVNAPPAPHGGVTALQLATIKGHVGLAQRMLELGAAINAAGAESLGRTALEGAAENGRIDILTLLLTNGACLTGTGRRQYIRSVMLTNGHVPHYIARKILISFGGWSDSDEEDMQEEIRKLFLEESSFGDEPTPF